MRGKWPGILDPLPPFAHPVSNLVAYHIPSFVRLVPLRTEGFGITLFTEWHVEVVPDFEWLPVSQRSLLPMPTEHGGVSRKTATGWREALRGCGTGEPVPEMVRTSWRDEMRNSRNGFA